MADLQERSVTIGGVKVIFPCKPYPSQFGMMDRVIKGLERRQNGLLESPTGSGKSLALLCSALAWQHAQHEKLTKEKLIAESGSSYCGSCKCGNKEYSPESKPNHNKPGTGSSHNPVELSDEDDLDSNDDDDDFKPKSRIRTPAQGSSRKHIKIGYEDDLENKTDSSPVEKTTKCTCSGEKKMSGKKERVPKIYFGSRTHKQIAQITRELKKTAYHDVRMAILASREHTCIHPEVMRMKSKSEGCRERLDARGPGCKYNEKSKRVFLNQNQLQDNLPTAWDIEEFVGTCKGKKACPYFVTRNIFKDADIIFCPYNYLIDPLIRNSMEIDLKDQIVILDEAHNMEDSAREAGSGTLTTDQVTQAIHNLQELLDHNVKFVENLKLKKMMDNLLQFVEDNSRNLAQKDYDQAYKVYDQAYKVEMDNLLQFIEDNSRNLAQKDYDQAYKVWSGFDIVVRLKAVGLGPDQFKENKAAFEKALETDENEAEIRGRQNQEIKLSSATLQTLEQLYQVLDYMYRDDLKFVEDYRVAILKTRTFMNNVETNDMWLSSRHRNRGSRMMEVHTLNFWCMNPAVAFSDFSPARNVILSSGTLSPMSSFASELGVPFPIQLEANHVIQDKQVWVGAIGQGPSGSTLQAVYKNMETLGFQDELGNLIHKVCMTVPHGVLCFLPSYRALEKFTERWKLTGLWRKIGERKRIMVEPRAANREVFDDMMKAFYRVVKGETSLDMSEDEDDYCDDSGIDGALFLAVCRGKVSEGMDFADNNARAVITVGIPYPSVKDLQVKLKREYNDRHRAERGLLSGSEWYEIQAFRALNQALGRCLRHRKDWGALIIVDDRFVRNRDKYCKSLSKWVRSKVQTFENFSQTLDSLSVFTDQMIQEMPVVDADTSFIPSTPGAARRESLYKSLDDSTIVGSPLVGSQGNSSYFSPPENAPKAIFKTPQSTRKAVKPTAATASEVSPKGGNPSAIQSPVTPSNQQFQQIMDIVNSAAAPKDKPYYIILNQGLPNEQTFLIEPPGKGADNKGTSSAPAAAKDLPVIAVPSTQKIMTPIAAKLANKVAASTSTQLSANQTGTTSVSGQTTVTSNILGHQQIPVQQSRERNISTQATSLIDKSAITKNQNTTKSNLVVTMTNQIQSSQLLLQNQNLVPLTGPQMLVTQPQGLFLIGNNTVGGQNQIVLTQPPGLIPVASAASNSEPSTGKMTSLLGNNTLPVADINSGLNKAKELRDPKNKFLKFVNFSAPASSKVATVAPMRPDTKSVPISESNSVFDLEKDNEKDNQLEKEVGKTSKITESNTSSEKEKDLLESRDSNVLKEKLETPNKDTPVGKAIADKIVDRNQEAVDGTCSNIRKRPLFKSRKSLSTQNNTNIDSNENMITNQEASADMDEDFVTEKHSRKDSLQRRSTSEESKPVVRKSKPHKIEMKEVEKSKLDTDSNVGKTFNAAGMTTRRKVKPHSIDSATSSKSLRDEIATTSSKSLKDEITTTDEETSAGSEAHKSVIRGETKKSVADKLKQFRRESIDDGILKEVKQEIHDNDFVVNMVKSSLGSPEDVLNTRRRRSGRKRKSSPFKLKSKRNKGVDFVDEVDDKKENQSVDTKPIQCSRCGAVFLQHTDFQKRRRSPGFLKKVWPQNAEVLFFPNIEKLNGLQVVASNTQDGVELNCCYDDETGCGAQFLGCQGCGGDGKVIGAKVVFSRSESEFKLDQE